jgi:hypothetical protein
VAEQLLSSPSERQCSRPALDDPRCGVTVSQGWSPRLDRGPRLHSTAFS